MAKNYFFVLKFEIDDETTEFIRQLGVNDKKVVEFIEKKLDSAVTNNNYLKKWLQKIEYYDTERNIASNFALKQFICFIDNKLCYNDNLDYFKIIEGLMQGQLDEKIAFVIEAFLRYSKSGFSSKIFYLIENIDKIIFNYTNERGTGVFVVFNDKYEIYFMTRGGRVSEVSGDKQKILTGDWKWIETYYSSVYGTDVVEKLKEFLTNHKVIKERIKHQKVGKGVLIVDEKEKQKEIEKLKMEREIIKEALG